MDINVLETKQAHDVGAEMRVRGPDGKLTDFYIKAAGIDSTVWRKIKMDIERSGLVGDSVTPESALAKATLSWRGLKNGKVEVEFSEDAAKQLYENAPYIMDQIDTFIAKRVNFLKPTRKK